MYICMKITILIQIYFCLNFYASVNNRRRRHYVYRLSVVRSSFYTYSISRDTISLCLVERFQ